MAWIRKVRRRDTYQIQDQALVSLQIQNQSLHTDLDRFGMTSINPYIGPFLNSPHIELSSKYWFTCEVHLKLCWSRLCLQLERGFFQGPLLQCSLHKLILDIQELLIQELSARIYEAIFPENTSNSSCFSSRIPLTFLDSDLCSDPVRSSRVNQDDVPNLIWFEDI